jgi:hypothetical protein
MCLIGDRSTKRRKRRTRKRNSENIEEVKEESGEHEDFYIFVYGIFYDPASVLDYIGQNGGVIEENLILKL